MRLIDADALKDRLDYCVKEGMGSTIAFTFKHMVEDAPTIEPKRGEWILSSDGNGYIGNPVYKCTVCGWWDEQAPYNFCPNCGARMKGEGDE